MLAPLPRPLAGAAGAHRFGPLGFGRALRLPCLVLGVARGGMDLLPWMGRLAGYPYPGPRLKQLITLLSLNGSSQPGTWWPPSPSRAVRV